MLSDEAKQELLTALEAKATRNEKIPDYIVINEKGEMLEHYIIPMILAPGMGFSVPQYPGVEFTIVEIDKLESVTTWILHVETSPLRL